MASSSIEVFEVGPRDGLQNEPRPITLKEKVWLIQSLVEAGIKQIELGAFVRPDLVPQMADTDELCLQLLAEQQLGSAQGWCLVPNIKGLQRALKVGVTHIAVFTAATEKFAEKNIGMSISQSLSEFRRVIDEGRAQLGSKLRVRGYVSTAFGCPFEGVVPSKKALSVIEKLASLGVDQISVGDTIGVATPKEVEKLIRPALKLLGQKKTAVHFHDTRGTALANTLRSMDLGVRIIDSSAGGFGGCPFAPGAAGNLATEDLIYMLRGMGIRTGINLEKLCSASLKISRRMGRPLTSRYVQTFAAQCEL
jgi:hydroxymethylglutaryl-CoA lyase